MQRRNAPSSHPLRSFGFFFRLRQNTISRPRPTGGRRKASVNALPEESNFEVVMVINGARADKQNGLV